MADQTLLGKESKRTKYLRRFAALEKEQSTWKQHWIELSDNFLPRRGRALTNQNDANQGGKRNQKLIDPGPRLSARTLASGMMAGMTSPARPWFRLVTPDRDLMKFAAVREWLYVVELRMREIYSKSNFYNMLFMCYADLGVFGTHATVMIEDEKTTIRCYPFAPGRYFLASSSRQQIDTIYRRIPMTVRQTVNMFGLSNVSERTKNAYDRQAYDEWIQVAHAIQPNESREYGMADNKNMAWASCYFEIDCQESENKILKESGFEEFPGLTPRWELAESEDTYGSSPAMDVLGCAKALQLQQKRKAQAIDKLVDPPMVGVPELRNQRASLLPGDVTYTSFSNTGGAPGFQPAYQIKPEISAMLEDIAESKGSIQQGMYEDLFLMLTMSDRREITAEEIRERHEEKLLMLGPVLERLNSELLDPSIDRTFAIMLRAGLIPPPPRELQGTSLRVEYISVLAQAQRLVATQSVERLVTFATVVAEGQAKSGSPITVFDKIDTDEALEEYSYALGVPPKIIRAPEEVEQLRQQRMEQQQAQQLAEGGAPAAQYAKAAKDLSETQGQPGPVEAS